MTSYPKPGSVEISRSAAAYLYAWIEDASKGLTIARPYVEELRAALHAPKAKKSLRPSKKTKAAKQSTKQIREECGLRSKGRCEACGVTLGAVSGAEMDHFFGHGKVKESVETCWVLCRQCHLQKTNNDPSAERWLWSFISHCILHGYQVAEEQARKRLQFVTTRKGLGEVGP